MSIEELRALAVPWYPRPVIKYAVLFPLKNNYPGFLHPESDRNGESPQSFLGEYYLIINEEGAGRYGSAKLQWENMHRRLPLEHNPERFPHIAWVKVRIPLGHRVDKHYVIPTFIMEGGGSHRECLNVVEPGTLVLLQPGGEVQFVRLQDEQDAYFSAAEAAELRLDCMTDKDFAAWAYNQAVKRLTSKK